MTERKWFGTNWADIEQTQQPRYPKELEPWKLEDEIKTRKDLINFMWAAVDDIIKTPRPHKKEMQWLKIACNDFVRIATKKGWVE